MASTITPITETKEVERVTTETVEETVGYDFMTGGGACMTAKLDHGLFVVTSDFPYSYGVTSCREAADFFLMLARELEGEPLPYDTSYETLSCYCDHEDNVHVRRGGKTVVIREGAGSSVYLSAGTEDFETLKGLMADAERYAAENP